eukprot:2966745-Amphidinium_carterae.1
MVQQPWKQTVTPTRYQEVKGWTHRRHRGPENGGQTSCPPCADRSSMSPLSRTRCPTPACNRQPPSQQLGLST